MAKGGRGGPGPGRYRHYLVLPRLLPCRAHAIVCLSLFHTLSLCTRKHRHTLWGKKVAYVLRLEFVARFSMSARAAPLSTDRATG
jgi:hypothetical protein